VQPCSCKIDLLEESAVIRRQVLLPVDQDRLWAALTDPDQAAEWFGGRIEWDVRAGAPMRFRDHDGSRREGRIEAVRPGRYLRYRWWTTEPPGGDESEVTYLIEPTDDGSRLTIQERDVTTAEPLDRGRPEATGRSADASSLSWTRWDDRVAGAWVGLSAQACARASA
jgi:uncharacterized protein YndB with AHSA1/START domain